MGCRKLGRMAVVTAAVLGALSLSSCSLLSPAEEEHKIEIVKEDVSSRYDLAMADLHDVLHTEVIGCKYSELSTEKLCFEVSGYKVEYVYVEVGDMVTEGQVLARLNVNSLITDVENLNDTIEQTELKLKQAKEFLSYYEGKLKDESVSLLDREDFRMKKQEYEVKITELESDIKSDMGTIEYKQAIIDKADLVSPVSGTVMYIRENLDSWTSDKSINAMYVMDASVCAFQSNDRIAAKYLNVGDPVVITLNDGRTFDADVSLVDTEGQNVVFDLNEPDYSISVGTRGTIKLVLGESLRTLSVPKEAVFDTDDYSYVYILTDNGVRELQQVVKGVEGNTYTEILSGLEPYQSVILRKSKK